MTGTLTAPSTKTPAVLEDERRAAMACNRRRSAELRLRVWRETECQAQVDPVSQFYTDPLWRWEPERVYGSEQWAEMSAAEKRLAALLWLRQHIAGLREIAARLGVPFKLEKVANDFSYGVRLVVHHDVDEMVTCTLEATVPADTTCQIKVVGTEHVPAHDRPITEKVCPPSIFATVTDDLVPADEIEPAPAEEPF